MARYGPLSFWHFVRFLQTLSNHLHASQKEHLVSRVYSMIRLALDPLLFLQTSSQQSHPLRLTHCFKEFLQLHIQQIGIAFICVFFVFLQGIVGTSSYSKSINGFTEYRFLNSYQYLLYRLLHHSVYHSRYS